ncbi:MAG: flavodoxin family protein [Candidatus Methanomethylophilus sp.]|nr:flavodoxin family protein [Methanomethylophilus sp.]
MTKIVAVNGSPRKGWNTDLLISEAAKGAESAGAEVQYFDLYKLENFTGCVSCFGCKRKAHEGECVVKDGLKPVLDAIKEADAVIMGAPNYFGDLCAEFKLFYERLVFPYLTYNAENPCCNTRKIPVLLIMTSNAPENMYMKMLDGYRNTLNNFIGPTQIMVSGETMQVKDYSKFNWTFFNGEERVKRRETVFPKELEKAFALGKSLV